MTKDVLITIDTIQYMDEEHSDHMETVCSGSYYNRNGKHYVLYDEVSDEDASVTKNRIKIHEGGVEISRKGNASTVMTFEENRKSDSFYDTPYGRMAVGISTDSVRVREEEELIGVQLNYMLAINDADVARCEVSIDIRPKKQSE